ncbi:MAG: hypothetical protein MJB14_00460 [Spirochaetes bacterium]|nr:hypothetical protein [Spirochaetota bacterium]
MSWIIFLFPGVPAFSSGIWGALAGGWQGFTQSYQKITGQIIGHKKVIYQKD